MGFVVAVAFRFVRMPASSSFLLHHRRNFCLLRTTVGQQARCHVSRIVIFCLVTKSCLETKVRSFFLYHDTFRGSRWYFTDCILGGFAVPLLEMLHNHQIKSDVCVCVVSVSARCQVTKKDPKRWATMPHTNDHDGRGTNMAGTNKHHHYYLFTSLSSRPHSNIPPFHHSTFCSCQTPWLTMPKIGMYLRLGRR